MMKSKGMDRVADLIVLNLLFLLCCTLLVTAGASFTAMHYTLRRLQEEKGSIAKDFWVAFKANFRQATLLWVLFCLLAVLLCLNFRIVSVWTGPVHYVFMVLMIVIACLLQLWGSVVFPLLARFENSTRKTAMNALLLALANPVRSYCALVINLLPVLFAAAFPQLFLIVSVLWMMLLCSVSAWLIQRLLAPVFDRICK